ncbi:hypothetical protein NP511_17440 [Natrinema thermotolerans]|uniref:Uncharacterized protein n=1 Tax=Natrinema thermotolerans TaxID=121872 RepID=A0AAF0T0S5_9EURY|nr:hypothetical protein [Natrinema thermotolerans]QCC60942.1 hypothetical protein DVR14_16535 [Natrinema thermotolerans]QCC61809.1 hypothetical protein DVR14_20655 [Natrinema thermotolerans]WMT07158.1 hypothetical protein NP511_17440 [Natrinema thermotolerans]
MTDELEAFVADRRGELAALALDLLAIDTANPPGDTREIVAVHAIDEYTTVDALVGNATIYARLPERWAAAADGADVRP